MSSFAKTGVFVAFGRWTLVNVGPLSISNSKSFTNKQTHSPNTPFQMFRLPFAIRLLDIIAVFYNAVHAML